MSLVLTCFIGFLAGTHAATWGMYKDAPHEGFTFAKYSRSIAFGVAIGALAHLVTGLDATRPANMVVLFGVIYAVERALAEVYKTFFRNQDQSKYTIPMQFAVFGKVVKSRGARYALGMVYILVVGGLVVGFAAYQRSLTTEPGLLAVLLLGGVGGWISAFGGAWKDAPIEGFETLKFFRSPLLATGFALILGYLSDNLIYIALGALGYTVATTETYKTFFFPSKPRGKFAGKPVLFPAMLQRRQYFIPLYAAIWVAVIVAAGVAFAEPTEGLLALGG